MDMINNWVRRCRGINFWGFLYIRCLSAFVNDVDHQSLIIKRFDWLLSMASESRTIAEKKGSETYPLIGKTLLNARGANSENHSENEVESENAGITKLMSTDNRLGFLSLPPELRVQIYRHLLLEHRPLSTDWRFSTYLPNAAILATCKLIRCEAFQVLYGENVFFLRSAEPELSILANPHVADTMQNLYLDTRLDDSSSHPRSSFIHMIRAFGSPEIIRGTLTITFRVNARNNGMLFWFARGLPRFTNFRVIQFVFLARPSDHLAQSLAPLLCDIQKDLFTPVFGPAISIADGCGLLFYPQDYLNS